MTVDADGVLGVCIGAEVVRHEAGAENLCASKAHKQPRPEPSVGRPRLKTEREPWPRAEQPRVPCLGGARKRLT